MQINYFDEKIETISREELEKLQLQRIKTTVDRALKIDFYKKKLNEIGIKSGNDINNLEDILKNYLLLQKMIYELIIQKDF